jgi:hypothetical protein
MNAARIDSLIRPWVDLYTRGMPPSVRSARRDEVDDDLWCHHQEAAEVERSAGALGTEMLLRLLFGMPADLSWRLAHGRYAEAPRLDRSPSMGARGLGTLAILAGVGWTAVMILMLIYGESAWTGSMGYLMMVLTVGAGVAFAATAFGLLWLFQEQFRAPGFMGGATAGLGGIAAAFDGAWAILLLPIGSAALAWDLARIGVLSLGMLILHALAAVAISVMLVGAFAGGPAAAFDTLALGIPYALSWIVIGASLWRGVPSPRAGSGLLSDRGV